MENKKIVINISGDIGAGKTVLGILLRRMLILYGANVNYIEEKYVASVSKDIIDMCNHELFVENKKISFDNKDITIRVD